MFRAIFYLICLLPGLLSAQQTWPPLELKPVEADLTTSFSSFFPNDNPIPELTIKMSSTWRIKPTRITESFLELEVMLISGLEKSTQGGTEVELTVGKVLPPEEQIPYFTLLNRPILIRILPREGSEKRNFEIVDPKTLNPIPNIAQQQTNLIQVLLLFFPLSIKHTYSNWYEGDALG